MAQAKTQCLWKARQKGLFCMVKGETENLFHKRTFILQSIQQMRTPSMRWRVPFLKMPSYTDKGKGLVLPFWGRHFPLYCYISPYLGLVYIIKQWHRGWHTATEFRFADSLLIGCFFKNCYINLGTYCPFLNSSFHKMFQTNFLAHKLMTMIFVHIVCAKPCLA